MSGPTTLIPEPDGQRLRFRGAGMTHRGLVRERNEDAILTDPEGVLWAVADGMGGHGHGELASNIVIDVLATLPGDETDPRRLAHLVREANAAVRGRAMTLGGATMGATMVAAILDAGRAHLAWAGDSRGYVLRAGRIEQLTQDHTIIAELKAKGIIDSAGSRNHAESHVVTRAVGAEDAIEFDTRSVRLRADDRLILCSDGVTDCLDDEAIAELAGSADDPDTACKSILEGVMRAGAPDNASVIVVFIEGECGSEVARARNA